jgi:hypothetical protein
MKIWLLLLFLLFYLFVFIVSDGVQQLPYRVVQAVLLPVLNVESVRSLILFDSFNNPHLYPADVPLSSKPPPVYVYIANPTNGLFQGFYLDVPISGNVSHILLNINLCYFISCY